MNYFGRFIDDLNAVMGVLFSNNPGDFTLNENGLLEISFNEGIDVVLQAEAGIRRILLSSEVVRIPVSNTSLWKRALELNYFELLPLGAFLAVDDNQSSLKLCQVGDEQLLEVTKLESFLSEFVAGVSEARRRLSAAPHPVESDLNSPNDQEGRMRV